MKNFDSKIEKELYERLRKSFSTYRKDGYSLKLHDSWKDLYGQISKYDILLYKWNNPLAIFEIKSTISLINLELAKNRLSFGLEATLARFSIITDNNTFYFYDKNQKNSDYNRIEYEEIIHQIINPKIIEFGIEEKEQIQNIFLKAANDYLINEETYNNVVSFIKNKAFLTNLKFSSNSNNIYFEENKTGISGFENQFFITLFGEFKDTKICRYTSLDTLYSMLNFTSFRMNGLVGMNDKSEVNYVDNYLNGTQKPLDKEHHTTISAINRRYITSCTTENNKDNLTMWRLYAEDSKGVCLTFSTIKANLNDHVLLQKVKYADSDGSRPELDFLKAIIDAIVFKTGFPFRFRKLGIWKHFFKSYEYSIEDEVRLMVIDDRTIPTINSGWVLTYTHSILNPFIDFLLNDSKFPVKLNEIMLGPKCPEQVINKVQIEEMIRRIKRNIKNNNEDSKLKKIDSDLNNINVILSDITHYR